MSSYYDNADYYRAVTEKSAILFCKWALTKALRHINEHTMLLKIRKRGREGLYAESSLRN